MPTGLELYDPNTGALIFGLTDRAFKKAGEVLSLPDSSGSVQIPELADSRYQPGYLLRSPAGWPVTSDYFPVISFSGTTMSYSPASFSFQGARRAWWIEYGFY